MKLNVVEYALRLQIKGHYKLGHLILCFFGIEIPKEVEFKQVGGGNSVRLVHRAPGLVIHPKTIIGERVHLYQGVTIGKKNLWAPSSEEGGCEVKNGAILCPGCKVLFGRNKLIIGEGTIIGANAVLFSSTGDNEIWAGIPAKKIGERKDK